MDSISPLLTLRSSLLTVWLSSMLETLINSMPVYVWNDYFEKRAYFHLSRDVRGLWVCGYAIPLQHDPTPYVFGSESHQSAIDAILETKRLMRRSNDGKTVPS